MSFHNPDRATHTAPQGGDLASPHINTMQQFEALAAKATEKGSNGVPGIVAIVVDKDGNLVYKHTSGYNGVADDAAKMQFDQTYFIASCTKLIASLSAMQLVERGIIGLDDPLDKHLPELTSQPIITPKGETEFELHEATKTVTLRHLITHSSGAGYEIMDPTLALWRQSQGKTPSFMTSGVTAKDCAVPRLFENGEGWAYGAGLDWVSLLVQRLTKTGFEYYITENIAKPLGIKSFTWHPTKKPEVGGKLMQMSERQEDGSLKPSQTPPWPDPEEEAGGAGMYANAADYARLLSDLLKDTPTIIKKETIELMFTPQFAEGSAPKKAMEASGEFTWGVVCGRNTEGIVPNYGLGGFIVTHDIVRENYFKPKNTLCWSGMPNLAWNLNRERGLATFYATQVLPWNDAKTQALSAAFETAVWRNLSQ